MRRSITIKIEIMPSIMIIRGRTLQYFRAAAVGAHLQGAKPMENSKVNTNAQLQTMIPHALDFDPRVDAS